MDNLIVPLISYYYYGIIQHGLKTIKSLKRHVAQSHAWSYQKPVQHLTHTNDISQALTNTFQTQVRGPKWIRVLIHLPRPFHCIYTKLRQVFSMMPLIKMHKDTETHIIRRPQKTALCIDVLLHIILRAEFFSFFCFPFWLSPFLLRENLSKDKA